MGAQIRFKDKEKEKKEKEMTSIIIPIRYRADLTRVCIDSVIGYTKDYELILVQEGEDKEITELLKAYVYKPYSLSQGRIGNWRLFIQNKEPKGYSGALNAGMEIATGDYFCFMNNDIVATPYWLDEMLKAFEDKEVGLVSPTFWGTGNRQSVDWNNGEDFDYVLEPLVLMGVCFLIDRQTMDLVGKWDEQFNHGGEDFDMTMRISNANCGLVIARKSFIYHYGGASTRELYKDLPAIKNHQHEMIMRLIVKHNLDKDETFEKLRIDPKAMDEFISKK